MPTIPQLPPVTEVTAADELPLSQDGVTHSVTVGTLLSGMQPAIITATGSLLGRISMGPGGPEPIGVGVGLALNGGTIVASGRDHAAFPQQSSLLTSDQVVLNSAGNPKLLSLSLLRGLFQAGSNVTIDSSGTISATGSGGGSGVPQIASLAPVSSIGASDLVAISQGGADHAITYANLLDGLTIDVAQPASPAGDADSLWVAQGSSTMLRQSFAAVWAWLAAKLPTYHLPVVELTTNTTLDGTVHNGRVLVCSQPITLTPALINMGSGFFCDVINASSGSVTFAAGITTSSGTPMLTSGQVASLRAATYSAGTLIFASMPGSGGGAPLNPPGQVTGVTASSQTTSSISLTWLAAPSGGTGATYTILYRLNGTTTWIASATSIAVTAAAVSGLLASTPYDFQVVCVNAAGSGPASVVLTASTAATATSVTSISWNMVPSGSYTRGSGSIGVNVLVSPSASPVQFGFSTSTDMLPTTWTTAINVNSNLWGQYVPTPAAPGTWYVWAEGTDGSHPTIYPTSFPVT